MNGDTRGRHDRLPRQSSGKGAALDRELLRLLLGRGVPAPLADLFEGWVPMWAASAAERLQDFGFVTRSQAGLYEVTDDGLAYLRRPTHPHPRS